MSRYELLAPAGSFEALKAAVLNGADAIYLGGTLFNARAFAKNFDNDELKTAVNYAHLRGVKIYVTVNTIFYDYEFKELISYISFLESINVDAVIIQDLGLVKLLKKAFPRLEIHISTQASVNQLAGVKFFEECGVDRVVLARENTLDEIKHICKNTDLEIEVFVHGALCMGYSGQCLMSSMIGKRSGNRGACAQPCRLPYQLKVDNKILSDVPKYLLSARDICIVENIGDFIDAGVTSFKIEGRMKSPEYVAMVVKTYRSAIDAYLSKKQVDLSSEILNINKIFNRKYFLGHAFKEKSIITGDYPSNYGVQIGKVVNYNARKRQISIKLDAPLLQGDGIRFGTDDLGRIVNKMYKNTDLVNSGNIGDIVEVEFDQEVSNDTKVFLTSSVKVINDIHRDLNNKEVKLPLDMAVELRYNQPLKLTVKYQSHQVNILSEHLVEKALNKPLDKDRIVSQLSKLGSTIYYLNNIDVSLDDNIQFPIKFLNELRRDAIEQLNKLREDPTHIAKKVRLPNLDNPSKRSLKAIHVHVQNIEQFKVALESDIDVIYYPIDDKNIIEALDLVSKTQVKIVPYVNRIIDDAKLEEIRNMPIYDDIKEIMIGDVGGAYMFKDKILTYDTSFNISNSFSIDFAGKNNNVVLSYELSEAQIAKLNYKPSQKIGFVAYGRVEMMTSKYCPISWHYFKETRKNCNLCKKGKYSLLDRKNLSFPIVMDDNCCMHLYNTKVQFIDMFNDINVDFIVLKATIESANELKDIITDYKRVVYFDKRSVNKVNSDYTLGYFKND